MSAKDRYTALRTKREHFLKRGRMAAQLTIPSLLPPEGHNSTSTLYEPYQDVGAEIVTNLASRIMTALYPPGYPSFRLAVPAAKLMEAGQADTPEEVEQGLVLSEKLMRGEIERAGWRAPTSVGLQHLIIVGNYGELMLPDNRIKMLRLDQYCVVRDPGGEMIEWVLEEWFHKDNLGKELASMLGGDMSSDNSNTEKVALYTIGTWDPTAKVWKVHQELMENVVDGSEGEYEVSPFNAVRWTAMLGEDYGRSKVEDHLPSLRTLEELSKALLEGAGMASRNITLIRPNAAGGLNLRRRLAKAPNGAVLTGNPEDIGGFQFTQIGNLQFVAEQYSNIRNQLYKAFLMKQAMQRDAERVTAYELQTLTEELEGALGGVYSMLSIELQSKRVKRLIIQMQSQGALPPWDKDTIEPEIITGLEALGRQSDVNRVVQGMQLLGPLKEEEREYAKMDVLLRKAFNGLDLADAVRTEDEVQSRRQTRMLEQVAQAGGEAVATNVPNAIQSQ